MQWPLISPDSADLHPSGSGRLVECPVVPSPFQCHKNHENQQVQCCCFIFCSPIFGRFLLRRSFLRSAYRITLAFYPIGVPPCWSSLHREAPLDSPLPQSRRLRRRLRSRAELCNLEVTRCEEISGWIWMANFIPPQKKRMEKLFTNKQTDQLLMGIFMGISVFIFNQLWEMWHDVWKHWKAISWLLLVA